jgi:hypothetical protein
LRRSILFVGIVVGVLMMGSTAALGAPGNNGTVKIDGVPFDQHPNNEPHVGCGFEVDFYGYDQGVGMATATFALHPPTGTSFLVTESVDIGGDPAGGGTDLDAELFVDLSDEIAASGASPHPNQGFHVKLTVHAPGSIGSDVKHKVFWVEGCGGGYGASEVPVTQTGSHIATFEGESGTLIPAIAIAVAAVGALGVGVTKRRALARRD